jgi:hypothetical protein
MEIGYIMAVILFVSILITYMLNKLFKKKRYVKYIPIITGIPFMLYNFITMYSAPSENFEALGRLVMGLFLASGILPSLILSIIFDIFYKKRNKTSNRF